MEWWDKSHSGGDSRKEMCGEEVEYTTHSRNFEGLGNWTIIGEGFEVKECFEIFFFYKYTWKNSTMNSLIPIIYIYIHIYK